VTLSREGKKYCDDASKATGVSTEILLCDYREIPRDRKFDKIASIEMAEHVGIANFCDPFLCSVRKMLKRPDSSFLLQVSGPPIPKP
jgi:cyclopropane fatty-acyl-phospholipid synthase-like methyltransferase